MNISTFLEGDLIICFKSLKYFQFTSFYPIMLTSYPEEIIRVMIKDLCIKIFIKVFVSKLCCSNYEVTINLPYYMTMMKHRKC